MRVLTSSIGVVCKGCSRVVYHTCNSQWLCVFFPGADEQDLSGDSEAGSDGRGVVPQAEVGRHGGDKRQHPRPRSCRYRAEQSRGMESHTKKINNMNAGYSTAYSNINTVYHQGNVGSNTPHTTTKNTFPNV